MAIQRKNAVILKIKKPNVKSIALARCIIQCNILFFIRNKLIAYLYARLYELFLSRKENKCNIFKYQQKHCNIFRTNGNKCNILSTSENNGIIFKQNIKKSNVKAITLARCIIQCNILFFIRNKLIANLYARLYELFLSTKEDKCNIFKYQQKQL